MQQPTIFNGTPVKVIQSTKHDGHMSFDKESDEQTIANIELFLGRHASFAKRKNQASIVAVYGPERTYDTIVIIDETNTKTTRISRDDRFACDALITTLLNNPLLLPVADCYPVVLFDPVNKALALAHLGWQASHAHLIAKTIKTLEDTYSTQPSDVLVYIGPGIRAEHYVFTDAIQKNLPEWKQFVSKVKNGYAIDLLGFNLSELHTAGITPNHIEVSPSNTVDDPDLESNFEHNQKGLPPARRYLLGAMLISTVELPR